MLQRLPLQDHPQLSQAPLTVRQRPLDDGLNLLGTQALQGEHPGPGQQRPNDLERRVFRGGADESHGAVFHVREYDVLLGLIKTVNLVDEQDGGPPVHAEALPGFGDYTAQVGHARGNGANRLEVRVGGAGHQAGQGGLAAAGGAPQDEGRNLAGGNSPPQDTLRPNNVLLAHELVEAAGAHAVGQGRLPLRPALPFVLK